MIARFSMKALLKNIFCSVCRVIVPNQMAEIQQYRHLTAEAKKFRSAGCQELSHEERFTRVQKTPFATSQIESEFVCVMEKVRQLRPETVVEIGAYHGGTLALLTQVAPKDCRFLSLDIAYRLSSQMAFKKLAIRNQKITCIAGDSSNSKTVDIAKKWLGEDKIDLLFIDGDHSLQGVTSDFTLYSPLVRAGGLIIFHDIVQDCTSRFGTPTNSYTGGVPEFWADLKSQGYQTQEFIADPNQDGYGIGLIVK